MNHLAITVKDRWQGMFEDKWDGCGPEMEPTSDREGVLDQAVLDKPA